MPKHMKLQTKFQPQTALCSALCSGGPTGSRDCGSEASATAGDREGLRFASPTWSATRGRNSIFDYSVPLAPYTTRTPARRSNRGVTALAARLSYAANCPPSDRTGLAND